MEINMDNPNKKMIGGRTRDIKQSMFKKHCLKIVLGIACVVCFLICFAMAGFFIGKGETSSKILDKLSVSLKSGFVVSSGLHGHANIALKQDYKLQECDGPYMKYSFPDVDYALLGYNILKGFPDAFGHDPGFTFPIFKADYTSNKQTADCRYRVPEGLVVVPDVSCETSFSSEIIQTSNEFIKSLSHSATASGGGFGVQFSASVGYKKSSSVLSTGESVFIKSTAKCRYYFVKLMDYKPPSFSEEFINWVHKLEKSCNEDVYFKFFDYFGTHFPAETNFGAKFTFENRMSSKKYETMKSQEINVAVSASYAGKFSVGGGYNMDSSQQEKASQFQKEVTTRSITIGAPPPANGDAMTWASSVKDSPVPISYKLSLISDLFTERYMANLNVNYKAIQARLDRYGRTYCGFLQNDGQVDNCNGLSPGVDLLSTRLHGHMRVVSSLSLSKCYSECINHVSCEAITFCKECTQHDGEYQTCYMFTEKANTFPSSSYDSKWETVIFTEKITEQLQFKDVQIIGRSRQIYTNRAQSFEECRERCSNSLCTGYTYCDCPHKLQNCYLYADDGIIRLQDKSGHKTAFLTFTNRNWKNIPSNC